MATTKKTKRQTSSKNNKTPSRKKATSKKKTTKRCSEAKENKKITDRERIIQEIRKRLVEQKEKLLSEAEAALNTLPEENAFPDLGDQASAEIDKNFMLRLRGREQKLIKKIELAIEKIDNGTYGICEVCGCEIGIKRLEARPVTTMCIDCKTEQEEEEKLLEA
ncbi:MAG: RNA polymerase-binding protein DksA [Nitrospirae bacterium]|nr:MAG: RNA polymerase-binding protein DksA [Nitrospirota bacterium]